MRQCAFVRPCHSCVHSRCPSDCLRASPSICQLAPCTFARRRSDAHAPEHINFCARNLKIWDHFRYQILEPFWFQKSVHTRVTHCARQYHIDYETIRVGVVAFTHVNQKAARGALLVPARVLGGLLTARRGEVLRPPCMRSRLLCVIRCVTAGVHLLGLCGSAAVY